MHVKVSKMSSCSRALILPRCSRKE
jgi:hypothetical protein